MSKTAKQLPAPKALLRAQKLANLTDTKFRIPFIGISLGLDFLVGLIPVVGDAIMLLVSLNIVRLANKLGLPKALRVAMLRNIVIDFVLGLIPFIGDIVDLFYKSNQKNVRIMEKWWLSQHHNELKAYSQSVLADWESK